jgi:integration host factor subunit alpha
MTLTKLNIVNLLREQLGLPKKDCLNIVNAYFEEISKGLEIGEEIKIPKLGNFVVKHKKSRPGRNPKTGEPFNISDRNVISFKASKKLREAL